MKRSSIVIVLLAAALAAAGCGVPPQAMRVVHPATGKAAVSGTLEIVLRPPAENAVLLVDAHRIPLDAPHGVERVTIEHVPVGTRVVTVQTTKGIHIAAGTTILTEGTTTHIRIRGAVGGGESNSGSTLVVVGLLGAAVALVLYAAVAIKGIAGTNDD